MTAEVQCSVPFITGGKTAADVTRDVCRPLEGKPTRLWYIGMLPGGLAPSASASPR